MYITVAPRIALSRTTGERPPTSASATRIIPVCCGCLPVALQGFPSLEGNLGDSMEKNRILLYSMVTASLHSISQRGTNSLRSICEGTSTEMSTEILWYKPEMIFLDARNLQYVSECTTATILWIALNILSGCLLKIVGYRIGNGDWSKSLRISTKLTHFAHMSARINQKYFLELPVQN